MAAAFDVEADDLRQNNNSNNHQANGDNKKPDVENQGGVDHRDVSSAATTLNTNLRRLLVVLNCAMLFGGTTGGPVLLRLYFNHGGHRRWFSSWLETGGWPIIFIPLFISYLHRRRRAPALTTHFMTPRLFAACAVIGVLTGADDYLYAYGLNFLPVSTTAILISTQLVFTAIFAFLIVKQRFTPYSINAVAMLTVGSVMLALHTSSDRPAGVTGAQYMLGFFLTLAAAALYGFVLPLVELTYAKAGQRITYTLVMEMQLVIGFFATAFCTAGMVAGGDFKAIPKEAARFGYGEVAYYAVAVASAIVWQMFFLGAIGVISCVNSLLAGVIIAVGIPVTEVLGVIIFKEKFSSEKGVSLVLSLWGLASYSYGEYREVKKKKKKKEEEALAAGAGDALGTTSSSSSR